MSMLSATRSRGCSQPPIDQPTGDLNAKPCPLTFFTEPSEADTISHRSTAASFSMATKASTGGTCRPSAPPLAPDRRREALRPLGFPPPRPAAADDEEEEPVMDDAILSQASRSGPSLLLHLRDCVVIRETGGQIRGEVALSQSIWECR